MNTNNIIIRASVLFYQLASLYFNALVYIVKSSDNFYMRSIKLTHIDGKDKDKVKIAMLMYELKLDALTEEMDVIINKRGQP